MTALLYVPYASVSASFVALGVLTSMPVGLSPLVFLLTQLTLVSQANMVAAYLMRFFNKEATEAMIDAVYSVKGEHAVVVQARLRRRFTRVRSLPYLCRRNLINLLRVYLFSLYLPKQGLRFAMNFGVPLVGPFIVSFLHLGSVGYGYNLRFMTLNGYNRNQATINYIHFKPLYYGFGLGASVLENLPLVGSVLFYANCVGAALMACDNMVDP